MDWITSRFNVSPKIVAGLAGLVLFSCGAFLLGVIWESQRTWANLLTVSYYLLGLGLGGAVFLALLWVTGAHWSDTIRPAVEKLTALLPAGAVGIGIVLLARPSLYPWTGLEVPQEVFQSFWLQRAFFLLRSLIYLCLWLGFVFLLVRASRPQAPNGPQTSRGKVTRLAAAFLVVFAVTCWLASTDWIMSLEPKWSSTIFGVYNFSGIFLSGLAAVIVLVIVLDRQGAFPGKVAPENLRDLGTLLFAFSCFWMYIWFSQYLLIWYVNNFEETGYFILRQHDPWRPFFLANPIVNWGVPFLVLLFRRAKESPRILLMVALIVLVGRWLDLYLMILPPLAASGPEPIWDLSLLPGGVGLAMLILILPFPVRAGNQPAAVHGN